MQRKLFFTLGTRPEAIKISPIIIAAKNDPHYYRPIVCNTAQHRDMTDQILGFFKITPDYDLDIMQANQNLFDVAKLLFNKLQPIVYEIKPDLIVVQGDTTTAFIAALVGFYNKIPIAHIEAGLRTHNRYSPYPEEIYRRIISNLANYHLAPTNSAKTNLAKENITDNIHVVGNTAIDALLLGLNSIENSDQQRYYNMFNFLDLRKKIILITSHRRENFGTPLRNICLAVKLLAEEYREVQFVYPIHPNPKIKEIVEANLSNIPNVFLIGSLDYPYMIWLMNKSYIIITDSGGIQEEAPSLGKPVLVTRDVTERIEGIETGNAKLVGTSIQTIKSTAKSLLDNDNYYLCMSKKRYLYGDGRSSEYILKVLKEELSCC